MAGWKPPILGLAMIGSKIGFGLKTEDVGLKRSEEEFVGRLSSSICLNEVESGVFKVETGVFEDGP